MKKIIYAFMFVVWLSSSAFAGLSSSYSDASTQLILISYPAATLYSDLGMTPISGIYYTFKPDSSTVSPNGDVSKPSSAVWIDLADMSPKTKDVNAKIPFADLSALASKKDADGNPIYPKLDEALSGVPKTQPLDYNSSPGQVINASKTSTTAITTRGEPFYYSSISGDCDKTIVNDPRYGMALVSGPYNGSCNAVWFNYAANPSIPTRLKPLEAAPVLAGFSPSIPLTTPQALALSYQDEIDKMLQDPSYVPVFTDATTGLPYTPPPSSEVATPAQIAEHNKNVAVAATGAAAATAAGTAVASGSGSSASYRAAADAAQAAAAANPGDAGLAQKAKDAEAAAAGAKLAEDKIKAQQAKDEAENAAISATGLPTADKPEYNIDIDKPDKQDIKAALMSFISSSPLFSMVKSVVINTTAEETSYTFTFHNQTITMDFARWDQYFAAAGAALLALAHGMSLFMIFGRD